MAVRFLKLLLIGTWGILLFVTSAHAAAEGDEYSGGTNNALVDSAKQTIHIPANVYPVLGYTSEIGLIYGAYNVMASTPSAPSRELFMMNTDIGYFTFMKMNQIPVYDWLTMEAFAAYSYWEEAFYGLGNHTPASEIDKIFVHNGRWHLLGRHSFKKHHSIAAGPVYRFREENRAENVISVERDEFDLGATLQYRYDSRDRAINASTGNLHDASVSYFPTSGSYRDNPELIKWELDARRYFTFSHSQVLATRVFLGQITGNSPSFMHDFSVGNPTVMRGSLPNRYTGHALSTFQVEYRFPIWRFIKGHVFLDAGRTSDELRVDKLHVGRGYGLFFKFPKSDAGFRFETASSDDSREFFAMFNYAF
ncbi:MAG: BamA/TamA family outer membrane protein [bacterium]|nr:BamA/TamA family outer membrane protein [bacterium]